MRIQFKASHPDFQYCQVFFVSLTSQFKMKPNDQ